MLRFRRATLFLVLLSVLPSCERTQPAGKSSDAAALEAVEKSMAWLAANPPDVAHAKLGEIGMDAWSWALIATLHPSVEVRRRAKQAARERLGPLEPVIEPTPTSLSWWAVLLRSMSAVEIDTSPYLAALSRIDLREALKGMSPTTALWTGELLRAAGVAVEVDPAGTAVASGAAASDWAPSVQSAYAIYHEIAGVTDLGRVAPRVFDERQLDFVRRALPKLLKVCVASPDVDAVSEVLITASILDQRGRRYYLDGMAWLLAQQRDDGTYRSPRDRRDPTAPSTYRHGVLVGTLAALESLRAPRTP